MKLNRLFLTIILLLIIIPRFLFADYHFVYQVERNYMGYKHSYEWEIWMSDSLVYLRTPRSTKIYSKKFTKRIEIYKDSTYYIDTNLNYAHSDKNNKTDLDKKNTDLITTG